DSFFARFAVFDCRIYRTSTDRFRKYQDFPRPGSGIRDHLVWIDNASDRVAEFYLLVVDRVSAENNDPFAIHRRWPAGQYLSQNVESALWRKAHDREGRKWLSSHRVNVVKRIYRGDPAVNERVI